MELFHSCLPIPVGCDASISHIAFDGCDYYCTLPCTCEIIRFSPCNAVPHRYVTCREYDCICYDHHDHCFWASSRTCCGRVFKLDCCMNEIDAIDLSDPAPCSIVTGISYNCSKNTLIVAFSCLVVEIDKDCESTKVLYTTREYFIMDVLCISPCMLLTVYRHSKKYIIVITSCGEQIKSYCMHDACEMKTLLFNPCTSDCNQSPIWAFVLKKGCYPYLCNTNLSFEDLGFLPYCCNYDICEESCCCHAPCPDCDSCNDIMESIALVETALSHILNAEGEKIQKALDTTDDIDKILCVNREVNKTIVNATHLEHTLYAKLSALSDCGLCDNLCDNTCDCKEPC